MKIESLSKETQYKMETNGNFRTEKIKQAKFQSPLDRLNTSIWDDRVNLKADQRNHPYKQWKF